MISEKIQKHNHSLKSRGLHEDSFFTAHFTDGSSVTEHDTNWSDFSETKVCEYFGGKKTVLISKHPIKKLHVKHGSLEHFVDVPKDCDVYQAVRSESLFISEQERKDIVLGRVIGLVKDGKVIEEYFLNGMENRVLGMKP